MLDWVDGIVQGHGTWVVAVVIFIESMGLPVPGESLLIGLSIYAASHGGISITWALFWAVVGAIMGDNVGYLIGHFAGRRALVRWGSKIGLTQDRMILGEYLFQKRGGAVVYFGRFIAFLRTLASLLAGATNMPWPKFLLWNALGGTSWVLSYGIAAYVIGDHIKSFLGPIGLTLGAIAIGLAIWFVVWVNRHEDEMVETAKRELGQQREAREAKRAKRSGTGAQPSAEPADAEMSP